MKIVIIIARILLGLIFVVFGLNGFLHFLPMKGHPEPAPIQFLTALSTTGYINAVFALQILGGALVLIGFVPLGLAILVPIIVNILLFHFCMAPDGVAPGIVSALLALFLLWSYRANFAGLFRQGT